MSIGVSRGDILKYAAEKYGSQPEYLWKSYPNYAVLRHSDNKKWYAVIMDVPRDKLGLDGTVRVDIAVVKCEPLLIGSLIGKPGILPGYHMNKNYWITVMLDGSADADTAFSLLDMSFEITKNNGKKSGKNNGKNNEKEKRQKK